MKKFNSKLVVYVSVFTTGLLVLLVIFFYQKQHHSKVPFPKKITSTSSPKASVEAKKARWEYLLRMLRDPATNKIPTGIRQRELAYAHTLLQKAKIINKVTKSIQFNWYEVGPNDIGGRTRAFEMDVTDPNMVIAGGVSGGIWKSLDGGNNWLLKSTPGQHLSVTSLAQDTRPGYTNNWYYATGEYIGNSASDAASKALYSGSGLYKSTDNGDTWTLLSNSSSNPTSFDSQFDYVSRIVISSTSGSIFIASNAYGIYRSDNGGNSFNRVLGNVGEHYFTDVVADTNGTIVAAISQDPGSIKKKKAPGIYKSTNDGLNWTNITPTTFPATHQRSVIAIAPSNPDITYVLTWTGKLKTNGREDVRFHKINISSGASVDRSNNLPDFSMYGTVKTFENYCMVIAVKPDDENYVLIGGTNLYRSEDGFATASTDSFHTWIGGYMPGYGYVLYPNLHCDLHAIAFNPLDPKKVWFGHDGGLSYTSDITTPSSSSSLFPWVDKNNGYITTQFYTVAIPNEANDDRIMGGTQDNGTLYFRWNGVNSSFSTDMSSGDGAYAYFGDNFAYTSYQEGGVYRLAYDIYDDPYPPGWPNWSLITPVGASNQLFINPFVVDSKDEDVMYYPAGNSLWRNDSLSSIPIYEFGTSIGWTELTNLAVPSGYSITALSVSMNNPAHLLYYGASCGYYSNDRPKMFRLENAHTATTGAVDISIPNINKGAYVHCIAVNPDSAHEILVVHSNYNILGLYHSNDKGANYTAVEGDLQGDANNPGPSLRSATILPTNQGTIYLVGTSTGVYSTMQLNGSNTVWKQESPDKIGTVVAASIASRKSDGRIAIGTHGRGIFIGDITSSKIEDNDITVQHSLKFSLSQNYPNPFNVTTTIGYTVPYEQHIKLIIFDALGREVSTLIDEKKQPGHHTINFDANKLASGLYFSKLMGDDQIHTKKLILLK